MIKIAENLQFLRKQKGKTQEEISEVFGVSAQSVSKWELGINCPDITMLPSIAEYYGVSIDELLGYKPITSINSLYINIKSFIESSEEKLDDAYKVCRLAIASMHKQEQKYAERLLTGKRDYSLAFGQYFEGITIVGDQSIFVSSFKDLTDYDITTIRKVTKYLNKISDINTLKVLFALFDLQIHGNENTYYSIDEICDKAKMDEVSVNKALNNLDVLFDKEEYNHTGIEKYALEHTDQVPLLIALLIPSLGKFDSQIKD